MNLIQLTDYADSRVSVTGSDLSGGERFKSLLKDFYSVVGSPKTAKYDDASIYVIDLTHLDS